MEKKTWKNPKDRITPVPPEPCSSPMVSPSRASPGSPWPGCSHTSWQPSSPSSTQVTWTFTLPMLSTCSKLLSCSSWRIKSRCVRLATTGVTWQFYFCQKSKSMRVRQDKTWGTRWLQEFVQVLRLAVSSHLEAEVTSSSSLEAVFPLWNTAVTYRSFYCGVVYLT